MERLRCLGHSVGEYVGGGQADTEDMDHDGDGDGDDLDQIGDADQGLEMSEEEDEDDNVTDSKDHLFFLFDIETTGLSIYEDHITEIAAKVIGVPTSSVSQPTFSSLVRTTRKISKRGKLIK